MSEVLEDLEKTRKIIRKKYQLLRREQNLQQQRVSQTLEPLITPLRELVRHGSDGEPGDFLREDVRADTFRDEPPKQLIAKTEGGGSDGDSDYNDANDRTVLDTTRTRDDDDDDDNDVDESKLNIVQLDQSSPTHTHHRDFTPDQLARRYLHEYWNLADVDKAYGPRVAPDGKYRLGNLPFQVDEQTNEIRVGKHTFAGTRGLYELIFKAEPKDINEADRQRYKEILELTGAHLTIKGTLKGNGGYKWKNIVKGLVGARAEGTGLRSIRASGKVRYVYFDDPNEICQRLELLLAEREAGNQGVDSEILAILEELQERGFILNTGRSRLFAAF